MNSITRSSWIVWSVALAAAVLLAVLLPTAYTVCYFVTCFSTVCVFALVACVYASAARKTTPVSGKMGLPLSKLGATVIFLQMILHIVFILLAPNCSWIIAALVECLALCVDAAAMTMNEEQSADQPVQKEGQSE